MSENTPKLLPCPFCGQTPDIANPATFQDSQGTKYGAVVCCCTGPEVHTGYGPVEDWRDEAIEAWNDRVVGWQPIETAPDDGTPVLLGWAGNYHANTGHCEDGVWGHLGFDWSFSPYPTQPTHWMTLPISPAHEPNPGASA